MKRRWAFAHCIHSLHHFDRVEKADDLEYAQDLHHPQDTLVVVNRDQGGCMCQACLLEQAILSWNKTKPISVDWIQLIWSMFGTREWSIHSSWRGTVRVALPRVRPNATGTISFIEEYKRIQNCWFSESQLTLSHKGPNDRIPTQGWWRHRDRRSRDTVP